MAVTKEQWEAAARAHGLEVVAEPQCPECGGSGEVLQRCGYAEPCLVCEGAYRPVSAIAACGCGWCGERPARPGSDCCAECLESAPTVRGAEMESMGGAL